MEIKYAIQHSFKEEIVIPIIALYNNFDFLYNNKEDKYVKTSDGYICVVKKYELIHICNLENKIYNIYKINLIDYIKRWYNACPQMDSMMFLVLNLEKLNDKR